MRLLAALIIATAALPASAQNADWKQLDFLMGKWTAVAGDSLLGGGTGASSFEFDLDRKIIIRRNFASYDSGVKHADLMIIYLDGAMRAIYFDNEGHVIRYNVSVPAANRMVLESDGAQAGPKYRFTYWLEGALLHAKFEIAPPGGEYKAYTGGTLKRDTNSR
jgi:hypothetical protein